eukprot:321807-Amphidinium_carterae.1
MQKDAHGRQSRSNSETRSNEGWSTQRRRSSRSSSARRNPRQTPELDLVLDQRDWNVAIADEPRVNMNCVYLATDQGVANRAAVILAQSVADMVAVVSIEPLVSVRQSDALTFRAWNRHDPKSPEKILHGYLSQLARQDVLCNFKVLRLNTKALPPSGAVLRAAVHRNHIYPNEYGEVRSFRNEQTFKEWCSKRQLPIQDLFRFHEEDGYVTFYIRVPSRDVTLWLASAHPFALGPTKDQANGAE